MLPYLILNTRNGFGAHRKVVGSVEVILVEVMKPNVPGGIVQGKSTPPM